jgi:hypothetical protein
MIKMSMLIPCKGAVVRLRKDGIVEIRIADDHICTTEEAKDISRVINILGNGKPVPVLRIAGAHSSIADGVREYAASKASQKNLVADAIVVHSLSQRLLGNFYLKMNRPEKPTQLFSSVKEAEEWLSTFLIYLN